MTHSEMSNYLKQILIGYGLQNVQTVENNWLLVKGVDSAIPAEAFAGIESAMRKTTLEDSFTCFRIFLVILERNPGFMKPLVNNQPWQAGDEALKNIQWPPVQEYYSARQFTILKRVT